MISLLVKIQTPAGNGERPTPIGSSHREKRGRPGNLSPISREFAILATSVLKGRASIKLTGGRLLPPS